MAKPLLQGPLFDCIIKHLRAVAKDTEKANIRDHAGDYMLNRFQMDRIDRP